MSTPNLNQYSGHSQPAYANQYQQYPYGNTTPSINASSASIVSTFSNASKASKFSALKKAFKRQNTPSSQPPPVPQKDPTYLQALHNSGYSSAGGHPAGYYGLGPTGSSSAYDSNVSLTLSEASGSTRASAPGSNLAHKSSNAASFFKFGRKSKKARSPRTQPPTPTFEVSGPRNVKHELHVDDGLNGLPATWHASLAEIGYTSEEIESIARRRRNPSMGSVPLLAIGQTPTPVQPQLVQGNSMPASPISQPEAPQRSLFQPSSHDTWRPAPRQDSLPASPASQHSQPQFFSPRPSVRDRADSPNGSVRSGVVQIDRRGSPTPHGSSPTHTGQGTPAGRRPPPPLFTVNPDALSPPATLSQPTFAIQQAVSVDGEPEPEEDELLSTTRAMSPIPRTPISPPRLTLKSDDRESINWSESLFSALPSATAFEGFRSSVVPPLCDGSTTSTSISRTASTSSSTVEPPPTLSPPQQQKTAAELRTDRGATVPRHHQANFQARDRGSTGSIGIEEPAIVARATAITIARAPSMKRSIPARVVIGGRGTPPLVPQVYGRFDLNESQQSLGSTRGSAEGSPVPSVVRTLAHQSTGSTDTGNSMPITPQHGQELLQVANDPGFESDEEDDVNRYTVRVDDAKAAQILAAVREAKVFEGRPISTASVATIKDNQYANGTHGVPKPIRGSVTEDDLLNSYLDGDEDEEEGSDDGDKVLDGPNPQPNKQPALAIPPLRTNGSKYEALYQDEISPMSPGHSFIASDGSGTPTMNSALPETPSPFLTSPGPGVMSRLQQQQRLVAPLNLVGKKAQTASNMSSKKPVSMLPLREDTPPVLASLALEIQAADPRAMFANLVEIAEGESGSVYTADIMIQSPAFGPPGSSRGDVVALKKISVVTAAPKINSVRHEMDILKEVQHENILGYHSLYFAEDALWLRMELMDRSCADLLALYDVGLVVEEKHVACVTRDTLEGLVYLAERNLAHRDLRSDNILISKDGIVKLADFSSAVRVTPDNRMRKDDVGVIYWQAPEIRKGEYDVMLVDVWSLGATVWELIEGTTPFEGQEVVADRLPGLSGPVASSEALLDFLEMCSSPPHYRPPAQRLLETTFVRKACLRSEMVRLLSQARGLEQQLGG